MSFAFVFPGQGSQSLGMMQGYAELAVVRDTFREAGEILNQDLWKLVTEGPEEALNRTVNTQPLMLVAGAAAYRGWMSLGGAKPVLMAGHSLGEYTALVAAEAMTLGDALPLVRFRAESMQQAVPEGTGGIAAILGLDDDVVRQVCAEAAHNEVLEAANFNSPAQVVIAGHRAAVERGMALAKSRGAKRALMLPMSAPSHCALMRPAADRLRERLAAVSIRAPQIPVLHNADIREHRNSDEIREALVKQLYSPVRWVETVRAMASRGITQVAECGPGKVLAGLNKRIDANQQVLALTDVAAIRQALTVLA